jgi:hypothetical protein
MERLEFEHQGCKYICERVDAGWRFQVVIARSGDVLSTGTHRGLSEAFDEAKILANGASQPVS